MGSAHKKNLFVGSVIGDPHKQILLVDRSHRTPQPPNRPVLSAHKKNLFVGSVIWDLHKQILLVGRCHRTTKYFETSKKI